MGVPAPFNDGAWKARYPEFSGVADSTAQMYYAEAELYWNNTACTPVTNPSKQALLMNMLTAHIAAMNGAGANGQGSSPLVGRINSAGEGSVNVGTENQYPPGTVQWFQQTKYGSAFWAATQSYRAGGYYRAKAGRYFGTFYPGGGGWQ